MPENGYNFNFNPSKPFIINVTVSSNLINTIELYGTHSKCLKKAVLGCRSETLFMENVPTDIIVNGFPKA